MGLGREEVLELDLPPVFMPGEKVVSKKQVRNDGTFPGKDIGDILVKKGDVGYVRDIGTYLQRYYVYAVEFVDRRSIVGMRAKELLKSEEDARSKVNAR